MFLVQSASSAAAASHSATFTFIPSMKDGCRFFFEQIALNCLKEFVHGQFVEY